MNEVLAMCSDLPTLHVETGQSIIEEGGSEDKLFILQYGAFEVVRNGVRIVRIDEPGAFLGEISTVLGARSTANVTAVEPSTVYLLEDSHAAVQRRSDLTYAIAQLLARRLSAITAYLVDIKRQYAGTDTHLDLMDQVLGKLISMHPVKSQPGSERSDVPDY